METLVTHGFILGRSNINFRKIFYTAVELFAERGLCVGNTYFEHKSLHKRIRVGRGQDGVEVKSMVDLALVKKGMLRGVSLLYTMSLCNST